MSGLVPNAPFLPVNGATPTDPTFRLIAESVPHIVWLAAPDGATVFINAQGVIYTGCAAELHYGWRWLSTLHPDDAGPARRAWEDATRTVTPYRRDVRIRAAGRRLPLARLPCPPDPRCGRCGRHVDRNGDGHRGGPPARGRAALRRTDDGGDADAARDVAVQGAGRLRIRGSGLPGGARQREPGGVQRIDRGRAGRPTGLDLVPRSGRARTHLPGRSREAGRSSTSRSTAGPRPIRPCAGIG